MTHIRNHFSGFSLLFDSNNLFYSMVSQNLSVLISYHFLSRFLHASLYSVNGSNGLFQPANFLTLAISAWDFVAVFNVSLDSSAIYFAHFSGY